MLGNGLDHGVRLGVGCDGRTLWLVVRSLNERRGRAAAANRALKKYTILNHELISNLYGYDSTTRDTRALPARAVTSVDLSSKLDFMLHSTRKLFKLKTINWDVVSRQILVSRMCVTAVDPRWPALG